MKIYDEGDEQKGFIGDEADDEKWADPEVEVDTDGPAAAEDSKDHPQEKDEKHEDVGGTCTCADCLVHLGCKNMQVKNMHCQNQKKGVEIFVLTA